MASLLFFLCGAALTAFPVLAADSACSKCPPGEGWVAKCPAGDDEIAKNMGQIGLDYNLDCHRDFLVTLGACDPPYNLTVISRGDPNASGISTELLSMCLTGGGVTVRAGQNAAPGLLRSFGTIEPISFNSVLANSTFAVLVRVDMELGGEPVELYNHLPLMVGSEIDCVPPDAEVPYTHPGQCVGLYDDPDPGQGTRLVNIVSARHDVPVELLSFVVE